MHAYTPLVGVVLGKSDTSYAVPASAKGEPALSFYVYLYVFVTNVGSVLGSFGVMSRRRQLSTFGKVEIWLPALGCP